MNCKHNGKFKSVGETLNGKALYEAVMNCIKSYEDYCNDRISIDVFTDILLNTIEVSADESLFAMILLARNCDIFRETLFTLCTL